MRTSSSQRRGSVPYVELSLSHRLLGWRCADEADRARRGLGSPMTRSGRGVSRLCGLWSEARTSRAVARRFGAEALRCRVRRLGELRSRVYRTERPPARQCRVRPHCVKPDSAPRGFSASRRLRARRRFACPRVVLFRRVLSAPSPRRIGHLYLVTSRRWDAAKLSTIGTAARGIQDARIGHRQNANSSNILKRCMVCIAPTASGGLPAAARERIARTGARLASSTRAARSGVLIFTAKVSHRHCFFARGPRRRPLSKA